MSQNDHRNSFSVEHTDYDVDDLPSHTSDLESHHENDSISAFYNNGSNVQSKKSYLSSLKSFFIPSTRSNFSKSFSSQPITPTHHQSFQPLLSHNDDYDESFTNSDINQHNISSFPNLTESYHNQSRKFYQDDDRTIAYEDMTAIDWQYEYTKERVRQEKLESTPGVYGKLIWLLDVSHIWIVLILTGIMTAIVAAYIDIVSRWLADIKFGYCSDAFYLPKDFCCSGIDQVDKCEKWITWEKSFHIENNVVGSYATAYIFYILFAIFFAAAACILVMFYAPHSRFSGIAEIKTILSGFIIRDLLGFKTLIFKATGLILVVGAGLWVGKEGPLVHVACCCANVTTFIFPQLYHNEALKREILSAAASAGISVAFGSPIGGVLFSLEQMSYYFPERTLWNSFVAAMVAAVTLQFINPFRSGNLVLFQVIYDRLWHRFELVPFAVIGVLGGIYGALFTSLNIKIANWRRKSKFISSKPLLEVVLVGLVTGLVTYPIVYTRIPASLSLSHMFQECSNNVPGHLCDDSYWKSSSMVLFIAGVQGFFLTAYTFGINIPAGIIMPSMLNGALIGRAIGIVMNTWQKNHSKFVLFESCPPDGPCITPGVYALVGAASTLCGVTHLTVSTVVIMFELTGALTYVIPIMTGVMVSKWVSDYFNHKGIYESWIRFSEYPFLDNHDDQPIPDVTVESIMTKVEDLTLIPADSSTVGSLKQILELSSSQGFPITKSVDDMTLVGYITRAELKHAITDLPLHTSNDIPCSFSKPLESRQSSTFDQSHDYINHGNDSIYDFVSSVDQPSSFHNSHHDNSTQPISLYRYTEHAPITLSYLSRLQLAASMFQKLGLRFILFSHKGQLKGLLTRKDVWQLLNSFDTDAENIDTLSESSRNARGRLLNTISFSMRGLDNNGFSNMSQEEGNRS